MKSLKIRRKDKTKDHKGNIHFINKYICFTLCLLLIFNRLVIFKYNNYVVYAEDVLYKYEKYTVKTWWDTSSNNGQYSRKSIHNDTIISKKGYFSSQSIASSKPYFYRQTEYYLSTETINGQTSYKFNLKNSRRISGEGDTYYVIHYEEDGGWWLYLYKVVGDYRYYSGNVYPYVFDAVAKEKISLGIAGYIYEHKDKDEYIETIIANEGSYPSNGIHTDGYWYINKGPVNTAPTISNISLIENSYFHNEEAVLIQGYIKDEDIGDKITLKYSIDGTSYTNSTLSLTNNTTRKIEGTDFLEATGNNDYFEGEIQLDQTIPLGENTLKVWAIDELGEKSAVQTITLKVKNTLVDIDKNVEKYIPIEHDYDLRFIVINTDDKFSSNSQNINTINSLSRKLDERDGKVYFVGQSGITQGFITDNLTSNYGIITNNNTNNILKYIQNEKEKLALSQTNIFTVGEFIDYRLIFEDIEKDYEGISITNKLKSNDTLDKELKKFKTDTLQIQYEHNPTIFDNPVAKNSKSDNTWHNINSMEDSFVINEALENYRGEWTMKIKVSDYTGTSFDKYSEDTKYSFIIHEKPKAIIQSNDNADNMALTGSASFDKDYQYSKPNKGIAKYLWQYQLEDGSWHIWSNEANAIIPKVISDRKVINYSLTVWDFHGASDTVLESIKPSGQIETQFYAVLSPELAKFNLTEIGIPSTEALKVTDIKTVAYYPIDKIEFALYSGSKRKTPLITLNNPGDIIETDGIESTWRSIRNYIIPSKDIENEFLQDGYYTAKLTLISSEGNNKEIEWDIRINTPINLTGFINDRSFDAIVFADRDNVIRAETSKYANEVTVNILGNSLQMEQISNDGTTKTWEEIVYIDPVVGEINSTAIFTAQTINNKTETYDLDFLTKIALAITGQVNPNPALAGERVNFVCETEGYAEKVTIDLWNGDTVVLTADSDPATNDLNTWRGSYIVPLKTPDATYSIVATAEREGRTEIDNMQLRVEGNMFDLVKPRIRNSN